MIACTNKPFVDDGGLAANHEKTNLTGLLLIVRFTVCMCMCAYCVLSRFPDSNS